MIALNPLSNCMYNEQRYPHFVDTENEIRRCHVPDPRMQNWLAINIEVRLCFLA